MITINFASRKYRLLYRLNAGFVILSGALAAVLAVQIWGLLVVRADIASMETKVTQQSATEAQIQPILKEREQLVRDLTTMAGLVESRRFSWTALLTGLETAFPTGVALTKFDYHPGEHALLLEGVASSPEALRNLMVGLAKSGAFKDPLLKHQSVDKGSISFNVVAFYNEHTAAGLAR